MNKQAFLQGFMEKCSEYDLTLNQSQELLKRAGLSPTQYALMGAGGGGLLGGLQGYFDSPENQEKDPYNIGDQEEDPDKVERTLTRALLGLGIGGAAGYGASQIKDLFPSKQVSKIKGKQVEDKLTPLPSAPSVASAKERLNEIIKEDSSFISDEDQRKLGLGKYQIKIDAPKIEMGKTEPVSRKPLKPQKKYTSKPKEFSTNPKLSKKLVEMKAPDDGSV